MKERSLLLKDSALETNGREDDKTTGEDELKKGTVKIDELTQKRMAKTTVTEETSQSQHDKTETTIKHPKEFQILTTEMPRKKSKPKEKEKEMPASSSNLDKEIKKKMKEIKEEKMRLDKELKEEKMRLDKRLKLIIEQQQEVKEKERGKGSGKSPSNHRYYGNSPRLGSRNSGNETRKKSKAQR